MTGHQVCTRCIIDTTVPGTTFDRDGVCSYCHLHDQMDRETPLNGRGERRLQGIIARIKASGKGKRYDCISGISGGRDSTYTLYLLVKRFGLRPLAVHFNDGFGNPTAGENMRKACDRLGVELRTISSDWRESKDLKIAFLKASTPDLEEGTDVGIGTALYGTAARERIGWFVYGNSFRTEGLSPLEWNYLDGHYLKKVHQMFGTRPLREWTPEDPGFNLDWRQLFYYVVQRRIKALPLLYYVNYVRAEAEEIITRELDWINTGAHYYDDLYQSLMHHVFVNKFNIDRRKLNWSALVRSGQMDRTEALRRLEEPYAIEDPDVIRLCIKRLGLSREEFDEIMKLPPKTFRDYPSTYPFIKAMRMPIWLITRLGLLPRSAYSKYFKCG